MRYQGALTIGFIWEIYGVDAVILFSGVGMTCIFVISFYILKLSKL
jgi:hypothetical protein